MTDTERLRAKIAASGLKLKFIATQMGLSYQALLNKVSNKSEFKAQEIKSLCEILGLDSKDRDSVFFKEE